MNSKSHIVARFGLLAALSLVLGYFDRAIPITWILGDAVPGIKLMVVGSAPAAIQRMILRRQREPMSDVCVLAAPAGFASVVQLKERLMDSDLASIIVRGKKGGIPVTTTILNAILREIVLESGK